MRRDMVIAIIGSRSFGSDNNDHKASIVISNFVHGIFDYAKVFLLSDSYSVDIISGGAEGTDKFVEKACLNEGRLFQFTTYRPDFQTYGTPKAYHVRNDEIISDADCVVAFWNGTYTRSGTASVIRKCINAKKKLLIFKFFLSIKMFNSIGQGQFMDGYK